jgi:CO/xanthine dehydrogenase FAD-binding subunit
VDLHTVERWRPVHCRADLAGMDERTGLVAGGTWLFSAPQTHLTELVDLHDLGWEPLVVSEEGLEIAATCTVEQLRDLEPPADWRALELVAPCVAAFASSPKVWSVATVGGNVCLSLPAGPMISLLTALDATVLVWCQEATERAERRLPIEDFVTGPQRNALKSTEVLRSLHVPLDSLVARTAFRRVALTRQGRSGAIVIGRVDQDGTVVLTVTAGTRRPARLAFAGTPSERSLRHTLEDVCDWYDDHHGSAQWRRAMTHRLAHEVVEELRGGPWTG